MQSREPPQHLRSHFIHLNMRDRERKRDWWEGGDMNLQRKTNHVTKRSKTVLQYVLYKSRRPSLEQRSYSSKFCRVTRIKSMDFLSINIGFLFLLLFFLSMLLRKIAKIKIKSKPHDSSLKSSHVNKVSNMLKS